MYQMVSVNCLDVLWREAGCLPTGTFAPRINAQQVQLRQTETIRFV